MAEKKGKLIIFSAPSGSGKTTIVQRLLKSGLGIEFSVSATSRAKRNDEMEGVDYYFLSADEFRRKISHGGFLEWEEVYTDNFYGTLKSEVERLRAKGSHVVFDVDAVGGMNIKKVFSDQALSIFIMPPSIEELENRLRKRLTEDEESLNKRMEKASFELSFAPQFDKIIINDNLEKAVQEAYNTVNQFIKL